MKYQQFIEYARAHYNNGGGAICECWAESDFDEYVSEFGTMTKKRADALFGLYAAKQSEIENAFRDDYSDTDEAAQLEESTEEFDQYADEFEFYNTESEYPDEWDDLWADRAYSVGACY